MGRENKSPMDAQLKTGSAGVFLEVNDYLTQFLKAYGLFRAYLNKMRKAMEPACLYRDSASDDDHHTF